MKGLVALTAHGMLGAGEFIVDVELQNERVDQANGRSSRPRSMGSVDQAGPDRWVLFSFLLIKTINGM